MTDIPYINPSQNAMPHLLLLVMLKASIELMEHYQLIGEMAPLWLIESNNELLSLGRPGGDTHGSR